VDEIGVSADRVGKVGLDCLAGEELGGWAGQRRRVDAVGGLEDNGAGAGSDADAEEVGLYYMGVSCCRYSA
jgi:hypothetical protein